MFKLLIPKLLSGMKWTRVVFGAYMVSMAVISKAEVREDKVTSEIVKEKPACIREVQVCQFMSHEEVLGTSEEAWKTSAPTNSPRVTENKPTPENSQKQELENIPTTSPTAKIAEPVISTNIPKPLSPTPPEINLLLQGVNNYRVARGQLELVTHAKLCLAAQKRVREAIGNFSHEGFEEAVSELGFEKVAENMYWSTNFSVEEMIESWDNSSGHRDNMLGDYIYGCGVEQEGAAVFLFMK